MVVTPAPSTTLVSPEQLAYALLPMVLTLSGSERVFRRKQKPNAAEPMLVMPVPSTTLVSPVQL